MKVIRDPGTTLDLDEFLTRPLFAHLATASAEGPRESPCWFLWEQGALWIIGETTINTFLTRIKQDPRVAVGIVDFDVRTGKVQHVGVRGTAAILPWDTTRAERLLRRYLGVESSRWDPERFQSNLQPSDERVFVRVDPETVVVRDQSYSLGKPANRKPSGARGR